MNEGLANATNISQQNTTDTYTACTADTTMQQATETYATCSKLHETCNGHLEVTKKHLRLKLETGDLTTKGNN